jgi:mRNA deadenylase 3'-5' endonuclease subunit Ccr4
VDLSFSVASYNTLASAYIQRAWYRRSPRLVLEPAWRVPALVDYISKLNADLFCLQEIEAETFVALRATLGENGYGAHYARKQNGHPDGLAILYRRRAFQWLGARVIAFADGANGAPDSGYMALMASLRTNNGVLGVINTHLIWDEPATPHEAKIGPRQAEQILAEYRRGVADAKGWIIAGDFNATPGSEIVTMLESAGFPYAHRELDEIFTCNVNQQARMIDYLVHSRSLRAEAIAPVKIDNQTILPSAEQPSDHVAILAKFSWQD